MSVQNLREKFNQPGNGAVSSPGTSFGVALKSTKTPSPIASKTAPPFAAKVCDPPPQLRSVKLRNSRSPSPERVAATAVLARNGSAAHLRASKSPSPDPRLNGVTCAKAVITNGDLEARARPHLKSPEQAQQEIIQRKWNRSLSGADEPIAPGANCATPTTTGAKRCVSRFIAHLATTDVDGAATAAPPLTSARDVDSDTSSADGRTARFERTASSESGSMPTSRVYGDRHSSAPLNRNACASTATTAMAARPVNSSFLHNDVRPKVGADLGATVNGPQLKATANCVPAPFVAAVASNGSAPKLTPAADRWKPAPAQIAPNAEPEFVAPKLNSAADRWKPAPAATSSEPEFRRVTLHKGKFFD